MSDAAEHSGAIASGGAAEPRTDLLHRLGRLDTIGRCEVLAVGTLVVAMVLGMVGAVAQGWSPVSDDALIELLVRDVPGHLPLTGVYSRYGWSHPGPALFYLLAVPYRLLGGASSGLIVGSLGGQLMAAVGAWWVARRIDRLAGLFVLCGASAILLTTAPDVVRSPWNPHVALVGSCLLVVLAWSASLRGRAGLIALVPVGSLLVQSHVVTAPMVAATCATGVLLALVPWGADDRSAWDRPRRHAVLLGLGLTFLMWLPPLVQQLTGDPGNLTELLARKGTGEPFGVRSALAVMSQGFGAVPSVLDPTAVSGAFAATAWTVPIWLVVPVAGAVVAFRRRDLVHLRGVIVASGALVGGVVGIASISDAMFGYLVMWNRGVVVATLALGVAALTAGVTPVVWRRAFVATTAVVVVLNIGIGARQITTDNSLNGYAPTVDALAGAVQDAGLEGTLAVDSTFDIQAAEVAGGVLLRLDRSGYQVTSNDMTASRIGAHRKDRAPEQLVLVAPVDQADQLRAEGWQILDIYQPLDPPVVARIDALRRQRAALSDDVDDRTRAWNYPRIVQLSEEIDRLLGGRAPMLVAVRPA